MDTIGTIANILLQIANVTEAFGNTIILTSSQKPDADTIKAGCNKEFSYKNSSATVHGVTIRKVSKDDLTEREAYYHKKAKENYYRIILTIKQTG